MANYNVGTTGIVVTADVEKALSGLLNLKNKIKEVNSELKELKNISNSFGKKSFNFDSTLKEKIKEVTDEYKRTNLYAKTLNAENRITKGLVNQEKNELAKKNLEIAKGKSLLNENKLKQQEINHQRKLEIQEQKRIASEQKKITREANKSKHEVSGVVQAIAKLGAVAFSVRRIARFFHSATDQVASFGENVNLFNVAMRNNSEEAYRFQYKVSQMYGANLSNTMKYQGQFMNIGQALGINTEMAYEMSEALTLLTYDLASLYNWTDDMAYNRLLAGLVGQTKPLRYAGIDVTQQTIQPILGELGIDKTVIQLTQQEKVMLRMIAVLRQSTNSHNDYGRTIESLSNQIKVWQHQVTEIMRWLGALWFQIASRIMPILNGLAMAVKEVIKSLAIMLGFDMKDFDFVTGNMDSGFVDLEEGAEGADQAIKKLNGSLRKFDEINNITRSSGGAGGFDVGGLTSSMTLQKALNEEMDKYRAKLSDVTMKATKIKDDIMQWLGFTRNVNDETGEVYYTNEKLEKLMRDIGNAIKFAWDMLVGFFKFITSDTPLANAVISLFVGYFITMKALALIDFFTNLGATMTTFFAKISIGSAAANVPLGVSIARFGALLILFTMVGVAIGLLMENWDKMSGLQKVVGVLGVVTLAVVALAIAVGALNSAVTFGIAGIAIVASIAAIAYAISDATGTKKPKLNAYNGIQNSGSQMGGGTYQGSQQNRGTYKGNQMGGGTYKYKGYASGGFPSKGEMFVMNEEEPEWIGNLGGRTAVMNQDQVVQSVLSLVDKSTNALSNSRQEQSQVVNLYADDILLGKAVIKSINKTSLATGLTIK